MNKKPSIETKSGSESRAKNSRTWLASGLFGGNNKVRQIISIYLSKSQINFFCPCYALSLKCLKYFSVENVWKKRRLIDRIILMLVKIYPVIYFVSSSFEVSIKYLNKGKGRVEKHAKFRANNLSYLQWISQSIVYF